MGTQTISKQLNSDGGDNDGTSRTRDERTRTDELNYEEHVRIIICGEAPKDHLFQSQKEPGDESADMKSFDPIGCQE